VAADGSGDRLFLRQGDVVPGRVLAVDEAGLWVDTAMAARTRIDRRHVKAVAFGARERLVLTDFTDPAWSVVTQAESVAERSPNEIVLRGPAWLSRSDLLPADEISFDVCWNDAVGVSVAVSLHTRDSQPPGTGQASVVMYRTSDDRVIVQGMPGGRGLVGASAGMRIDNGRTQARLLLGRQEIVVADGDTEIMRIPHGRADQAGRGFMLHVQRTAGGGVFASGRGQPAPLTISHFRARQSGEDLPSLEFDPQEKTRVLTVPRSRATAPPTEILVARNGDLLRGHLVALDEQSVRFRSQRDELSFSRDRLAGIIWPAADTPVATPAEVDGVPVRVIFARDAIIRMTARSMTDHALLGHHAVLGAWEVPLPLIRELHAGPATTAGASTAFQDWVLRPAEEPSHASH
jgi:hypothetical protein